VEYAFLNGLAQQYTLLLELRSKIQSSATPALAAQDHLAGVPSLQCTVCLGNQAMMDSPSSWSASAKFKSTATLSAVLGVFAVKQALPDNARALFEYSRKQEAGGLPHGPDAFLNDQVSHMQYMRATGWCSRGTWRMLLGSASR
jgi:hypothetical protein